MKISKRLLTTLVITLTLGFGITSCKVLEQQTSDNTSTPTPTSPSSTSSSPTAKPTNQTTLKQVRFGTASVAVDYGPFLIAKNKGWIDEDLKKKGIISNYTTFQSVPPVNESLATGRVDVVFAAEPPAIVGKAAGIDVQVVDISCSLEQEILVRTDSPIKTIQDLKGKKIAVLSGSSSHYGLLKIIKNAGLQPSDVEIVSMIPPDAKNAFETGKVEGWAVWPPFVEQEELAGKGQTLPKGDAQIHSLMLVRGKFAQENPEVVRELTGILEKTKKWMQDNPAESQQIVAKEINVPVEVVKQAWPRHNWDAKLTPTVIADIQAKADFLKANNFIQKPVDVKTTLINLSFLPTSTQSQSTTLKTFAVSNLFPGDTNLLVQTPILSFAY